MPSESTLSEEIESDVDPIALKEARGKIKLAIARHNKDELSAVYDQLSAAIDAEKDFKVDAISVGRRRLRNTILSYLTCIKSTPEEQVAAAALADSHYKLAKGMTDKVAALNALASMDGEGAASRDEALIRFYNEAAGDALVLNKWFSIQASADLPDVLDRVKALTKHPDFTLSNPNRFRSLVGAFTANSAPFHAEDGEGYRFVADLTAEIDKLNPQVSSRLATSLIQWRKYGEKRAEMMKGELQKLSEMKLSEDLYEVVSRGLK